jgi:hypothetical protein
MAKAYPSNYIYFLADGHSIGYTLLYNLKENVHADESI